MPHNTPKTVSFLAIWLVAAYNFAASIYYHAKAQRPESRTGLEPFILWRNDCLTPDGLEYRRRGTRAVWRFLFTVVGFGIGELIVNSWARWLLRQSLPGGLPRPE